MANKKGATGGAANAGGVQFQQYGAAWAAVGLLLGCEARLPWNLPRGTTIRRIECEQDAAVDDVLLRLSSGGTVYLQFKHGLSLGSEFNKAVAQLASQYCATGFFEQEDRLVIFTDTSASGTVRQVLRDLLERLRDPQASLTTTEEKEAFADLAKRTATCWPAGKPAPTGASLRRFLRCVYITVDDLHSGERVAATLQSLGRVVEPGRDGDVWSRLLDKALTAARVRHGFDRLMLWEMLKLENLDVVPPHVVNRDGIAVNLAGIVAAMTREAVAYQANLGAFDESRFISRTILDREWRTFCASDARLFGLVGQSGHGKTNACLHYALACSAGSALLLRGETLEADDVDLCASVCRLIAGYCERQGLRMPLEFDVREWLKVANLILIVDGLDRSSLGTRTAGWMSGTLAWLRTTRAKLAVGTRPESWPAVGTSLMQLPWLMYRDEQGSGPLHLEPFTQEEAEQAAARMQRPDLARYRHPGMMSLAALSFPEEPTSLRHCDVIERYLEHRRGEIVNLAGSTEEEVLYFLRQLAGTFLRADRSNLRLEEIESLLRDARSIYQAVRKTNLLAGDNGQVRLHPDEVAEHLQAQQLDIEAELDRVEEILEHPVRLGILRSAIVQAEVPTPEVARTYLRTLVSRLDGRHGTAMRALCVPILLEMRDWTGLLPVMMRLVESWNFPNLILASDPLVDLLASKRLPPKERLVLLWGCVLMEDGYDWRTKHWLTPEYAPNFRITKWARLMQEALIDARSDGLSFVLQHFDATDDLDCSESSLGDLAQGLYFRAAETMTGMALDLLVRDTRRSARNMMRRVCRRYPAPAVDWLSGNVGMMHDEAILNLLLVVPPDTVAATYRGLASTLLIRAGQSPQRRLCLLALVIAGDSEAADEMAQLPELQEFELNTLLSTRGEVFASVVQRLFARLVDGSLPGEELAKVYVGGSGRTEIEAMLVQMEALVERQPVLVSSFSYLLEAILYALTEFDALPDRIEGVVRAVLAHGSETARKHLIYFATSRDSREKLVGDCLRFQHWLLGELLTTEHAESNLRLLVQKLITDQTDHVFADARMHDLCRRFPHMDLMTGTKRYYSTRPPSQARRQAAATPE